MIISHQKKFIFVANGKTGSEAIETALRPYHDEPSLICSAPGFFNGKHVPAAVLREVMGGLDWSQYFKFGIVRHPVDRFLSAWRHHLREQDRDVKLLLRHPRSTLQLWRHTRLLAVPPIPDLIEEHHVQKMIQTHAAVRLKLGCETNLQYPVFYDAEDRLCVDFVGRYESLSTDVATVAEKIGIPIPTIPVVNVGKGKREGIVFSRDAMQLLERTYAEDFKRFGYEFR